MLSLGPLPMALVLLLVSLVVALVVARRVAPCRQATVGGAVAPQEPAGSARAAPRAGSLIVDMLLTGVVVARLGFVLRWWPQYLADPWSLLRVGDGGFMPWTGVLAALAWALWRVRRTPQLHRPLWIGVGAGVLSWMLLAGALLFLQQTTVKLPATQLSTLDGATVSLQAQSGPLKVVNLWATWCPPCLREMPVLADAQQRHGDIDFFFVNQGEGADTIRSYLQGKGLVLDNVLLDPFSSVMQEVGSRGLPTTLFFDASGRLVDTHMGELSQASLGDKLRRFGPAPADIPPPRSPRLP